MSDPELVKLSRDGQLSLSLEEMREIKKYFAAQKREPTDVELEAVAQTWSEHCGHKTFKGVFLTNDGEVCNIFKKYIAAATKKINAPWCFSVFEDNAGIVEFEGDWLLSFKAETHNHPSALEPFGGAVTGVGGVIRDILGAWGDPIANTDILCFGPLDFPDSKLPAGTKRPQYIHDGVISGIQAYGNNMGIPTINGAIYFDESYVGNPLVFCGCLGMLRKKHYVRRTKAGDVALLVGGKTGRDGMHGVTFASVELHEKSEETSRSAVQIGDPIEEEKIKRAMVRVREEGLASGTTDLGGGGLSSAVTETAQRTGGIEVHLDNVRLKYPMSEAWEIWISESQERMLLTVPPQNLERVTKIFESEEVEAVPIGIFNSSGKLRIKYKGAMVADLDLSFMFGSSFVQKTDARFTPKTHVEPAFSQPKDLTHALLKILGMPNVMSKRRVIQKYDHEVKGNTAIKPLHRAGPGDAAVLKPLDDSWKGAVLSNGFNPEYGKISAYWMAASAIDEAIRNNAAVGGRRFAILDNFSWGTPNKPENALALLDACRACYDFGVAFNAPFISGKDSLYNESPMGSIAHTLVISALGISPDVRKCVTMDVKREGNALYLVGETKQELGGSHYYKSMGYLGASVPQVDKEKAPAIVSALTSAIDSGAVRSCHDLSEGGLGVALAESCFAGGLGADVVLPKGMRSDFFLFSESNTRFVVETENEEKLKAAFKGLPLLRLGTVGGKRVRVAAEGKTIVDAGIDELRDAWEGVSK
ncbi:Phosphoribosylformylglycinamidine synthase subunit PurL [Candidatus Norongarragalina meridionalis]|nr:Phosphoribosylformylglycinamidine synthase subunit PurL [Candidatus Norongarragalina meridionalis]